MPVPWLVVLKNVPWTDVIKNAPKVADGARKLWSTLNKKAPVRELPVETPQQSFLTESQAITLLQARIAALEAGIAELHNQMFASTELINRLAEQNTQLIERIEKSRIRIMGLASAMGILSIIVLGLVAWIMR